MASHDLQAPLRKMRMFSDRLLSSQKDTLSEEARLYLSRIQLVAKRMQDLINDILKFSKITVERESLEEVDMNQVVQDVLSEMDLSVREKKAKITLEQLP